MPTFFFDIHVCDCQLEPQTQRERLALALKLGYDGVALVHQAKATLTERDRCSIRPTQLAALLSAAQGVSEALEGSKTRHAQQHGNAYSFRQISRLNFPADDVSMAQAAVGSTSITSSYGLLAVQPQSERAFAAACSSLDVDIVSVDLSRRLPYRFKPSLVRTALDRGLHFEICFSAALREAGARRQLFTNAQALCRETRGRSIIVSSCARSAMELRGPHDVMNMATLFGLTQQQAQAAISSNVEAALRHAEARKAHRGVLIIQVAQDLGSVEHSQQGAQPEAMQVDTAAEQGAKEQGSRQPPPQQQQQGALQQQQPLLSLKQKFGQAPPQLPGKRRR